MAKSYPVPMRGPRVQLEGEWATSLNSRWLLLLLLGESHHERVEFPLQLDPPPYSCDCLDFAPGFLVHLLFSTSPPCDQCARMRGRHGVSRHMWWRSVFIGHRCCGDRTQSTERRPNIDSWPVSGAGSPIFFMNVSRCVTAGVIAAFKARPQWCPALRPPW